MNKLRDQPSVDRLSAAAVALTRTVSSCSIPAPPTFTARPLGITVGLNGFVSFDCSASGNPKPSVFWTKEGSQTLMFPNMTYDGHIQISNHGSLKVEGAQKEDAGYYICSALSVAGSSTARVFLQVTSSDEIPPPIIEIGPANQTLPKGSVAMLPCRSTGNPKPKVKWLYENAPIQLNNRVQMVQSGTLRIDGEYCCNLGTHLKN